MGSESNIIMHLNNSCVQRGYESLINVYSRVLMDQRESREAVGIILENMDIL